MQEMIGMMSSLACRWQEYSESDTADYASDLPAAESQVSCTPL